MSMVSHLHHLFHPETCQAYIHRLRWKDRPLQCPRCQRLVKIFEHALTRVMTHEAECHMPVIWY